MFSSLKRWFSGTAPERSEPIEVFALPLLHEDHPDKQIMRVFFTDDAECAQEPVFLRKKLNHLWNLTDNRNTELAEKVRNTVNWTFPDFQNPLARFPEGFVKGMNFYAADLVVPRKVLDAGYLWQDINAGILLVEFDGRSARLLGRVRGDKVARLRLRWLEERNARYVDAAVVQANYILYEPGVEGAPCLVLFSFDPSTPWELLLELADLMGELKGTDPSDPDLQIIANYVTDETFRYHDRKPIPRSLTEGFEIFAADLWLHRSYLRDGLLSDTEIPLPCLAGPGDKGGIELLPFDEADDYARRE